MLNPASTFAEVAVVFIEPLVLDEPLPLAFQFQATKVELFSFRFALLPELKQSAVNEVKPPEP